MITVNPLTVRPFAVSFDPLNWRDSVRSIIETSVAVSAKSGAPDVYASTVPIGSPTLVGNVVSQTLAGFQAASCTSSASMC
jgi:hypothetical protein